MVQLVASLAVALRSGGGHHAARGALEAGAGLVVAVANKNKNQIKIISSNLVTKVPKSALTMRPRPRHCRRHSPPPHRKPS